MTLRNIKQHMQQAKLSTLSALCTQFCCDEETMRCWLRHWVNKGCIRLCIKKSACGTTCTKCPKATLELYEWVDVTSKLVIL
jgi:hypothetical protein